MKKTRYSGAFAFLAAALLVLLIGNIHAGSVRLPVGEVLGILAAGPGGGGANGPILWNIRLPRLLAALILGGALSVSGFLLQTFFANPIAGPFVLGISSGAKLTVSLMMIFLLKWKKMMIYLLCLLRRVVLLLLLLRNLVRSLLLMMMKNLLTLTLN